MNTPVTLPKITTPLFSGELPMGYHTWSDLLFVHWRVPPEMLAPLIPEHLEVETFDGDAWLGLVAFHMSGIRPSWFPALPFVSEFHETNIRTYVRAPNGETGVRFFSLDAACWPAVKVARWRWHLPYFHSAMELERTADRVCYASHRKRQSDPVGNLKLEATIGDWLRPPTASEEEAREYDLEFDELGRFLVDRYVLFADGDNSPLKKGSDPLEGDQKHNNTGCPERVRPLFQRAAKGGLVQGQVGHNPYPIRAATVTRLDETLTDALGIPLNGRDPDHVAFSEGVKVEVFPLTKLNHS